MRKQHNYYVYITTNPNKKVLYIGVTNNLARRLVEHYANRGKDKTFAGRYYAYHLIHYEHFKYINQAIAREKEIKKWNRKRKEELIAIKNPKWKFYNDQFCGEWPPRKIWGNYLEKFKQQKQLQAIPVSEESTVCLYEDGMDTISLDTKVKTKQEALPISSNLLAKLIAIEHRILESQQLSKREKSLITIALLTALDYQEELALKIKEIPKDIIIKEDVEEVLLYTGFYAGFAGIKTILEKVELFFDEGK